MKNLKKVTSLILTGMLCVALAACGKAKEENNAVITPDNENTTAVGQETSSVQEGAEGGYKNDVAVADIEAAVMQALGENYWPQAEFDSLESLEITSDMYEEFLYKVPMINVNVDTLIVIKAVEGKEAEVEEKLNQFRDRNINELMQYPMNLPKIQCSQVQVFGNYVVFVQFGADEASKAIQAAEAEGKNLTEDELAKLEMDVINEQNEIALEAIKNVLAK